MPTNVVVILNNLLFLTQAKKTYLYSQVQGRKMKNNTKKRAKEKVNKNEQNKKKLNPINNNVRCLFKSNRIALDVKTTTWPCDNGF